MYNWDFCDQNMSLARLVRWVPPSAALGLLIRIRIGLKGGGSRFTVSLLRRLRENLKMFIVTVNEKYG